MPTFPAYHDKPVARRFRLPVDVSRVSDDLYCFSVGDVVPQTVGSQDNEIVLSFIYLVHGNLHLGVVTASQTNAGGKG